MRDKPLILVVDDESHILHVVTLKMTNAGYEIITAEDGEEGFEVATEHLPDLIITDYQMPFMTGLELCVKLKEQEATSAIPAIMLTARGSALASDDLNKTNISSVISKPFSPREILLCVQELIGSDTANTSEIS